MDATQTKRFRHDQIKDFRAAVVDLGDYARNLLDASQNDFQFSPPEELIKAIEEQLLAVQTQLATVKQTLSAWKVK